MSDLVFACLAHAQFADANPRFPAPGRSSPVSSKVPQSWRLCIKERYNRAVIVVTKAGQNLKAKSIEGRAVAQGAQHSDGSVSYTGVSNIYQT